MRVFEQQAFATECVHAGREDLTSLGVHAPPIDLSSTYPIGDHDQAALAYDTLAAGAAESVEGVYSRLFNPTVSRYERAIARLERCDEAVAFGSGMAALTACLIAVRETHSHVVSIRPIYGGTDHLLSSRLLGVDVTWVAAEEVASALRPETGLILCETPQNPTLAQIDIAALAAVAGDVPILVDSTFATPVLQRPAEQGASIVMHSATKALGGHGDVLAGIVAAEARWAQRIRQVRVITGAVLHPMAAFLLHRSLQTLELRVLRAQATAGEIAGRLAADPRVDRVLYPGLPDGDPLGLLGRQLKGPGAVLAFEVAGGCDAARALVRALDLITPAVSLGCADTLIEHPASLTHRIVDSAILEAHGITPALLRLSVGLEDVEDLWSDLDAGIDVARSRSGAVAVQA